MPKSQFLTNLSNFMMVRRYSRRTNKTYTLWIRPSLTSIKKSILMIWEH